MVKKRSRVRMLLWSTAGALSLWVVLGDRVVTRWAYALERGRIQASSDELAQLQVELPEVQTVSRAFRLVAKVARPGVVHLYVQGGERSVEGSNEDGPPEGRMPRDSIHEWFRRTPPGLGSGIILDTDGHILTNNHVVEGRDSITVILYDDREFEATIVGTDAKTDLAVLKINATDLHPLQFGDSSRLEVGDWVIAVGAPFGLTQTVTHGIVSAVGRKRVPGVGIDYQDFIQTDAAINPGNSGGPLLNLRGEVVGVNTAIATRGDGVNAGVAFTIPSNLALRIVNQLKAAGTVRRGWLGILHAPVVAADVELFGLPAARGVVVNGILQDSPAGAAGLEVEDVIVAFNGRSFDDSDEFRALVADVLPDEEVRLLIVRDGVQRELTVKLGLQPANLAASRLNRSEQSRALAELGLRVRTLRASRSGPWRLFDEQQRGVAVVGVEPNAPAGVESGLLITAVNGQAVRTVAELRSAVRSADRPTVKLELLEPSGDKRIVTVELRR